MSASMQQGLADLLVRKTTTAKRTVEDVLSNVRRALLGREKDTEYSLYSDLAGAVENQLRNADNLLKKQDASYFNYLDALRNLNVLRDVVSHELRSLGDCYGRRQHLQKTVSEVDEQFKKREAKKNRLPDPGYPRETDNSAAALALWGGYFYVGYVFASHADLYTFDWWFALLLWPLGFALALLVNIVKGKIGALISDPSNASAFTTVFLGLIPSAVVYVAIKAIIKGRKARYNRVHQKRNELTRELDELSKQVSSASNSLDMVETEISGYCNKCAQKIRGIKWKSA